MVWRESGGVRTVGVVWRELRDENVWLVVMVIIRWEENGWGGSGFI